MDVTTHRPIGVVRPARLRVVEGEASARRRALRSTLVPGAMVLMLAVFGVVALEAYLSQEGFRAARLERELRRAQDEHALLRARAADVSSPSRLQESAAKIGMAPAPDPTFLRAPAEPDPPPAELASRPPGGD